MVTRYNLQLLIRHPPNRGMFFATCQEIKDLDHTIRTAVAPYRNMEQVDFRLMGSLIGRYPITSFSRKISAITKPFTIPEIQGCQRESCLGPIAHIICNPIIEFRLEEMNKSMQRACSTWLL
jgi:hypothetical protein